MRKLFMIILPLLILSCGTSKPQQAEEAALQKPVDSAVSEKEAVKKDSSIVLTKYSELSANLNKKVTVSAKKSEFVMQHMMAYTPSLPEVTYIDLDGGAQIAVYSLKPLPCKGKLKITGTVGKVSGAAKGGGGTHSELYLYVDEWECMD
ncbi:MAG: hypothetical protein A2014_01920 [Spirochaetes bacterium GWF1_49_6]|nr:MAG: hypothetical protein A2014_01920 [Spirochaetes bacterium GWF1_49_6]